MANHHRQQLDAAADARAANEELADYFRDGAWTRRVRGRVKWFDARKRFGFITTQIGIDVFLHVSELPDGADPPQRGQPVEIAVSGDPRERPVAKAIEILPDDAEVQVAWWPPPPEQRERCDPPAAKVSSGAQAFQRLRERAGAAPEHEGGAVVVRERQPVAIVRQPVDAAERPIAQPVVELRPRPACRIPPQRSQPPARGERRHPTPPPRVWRPPEP
eukprot:gene19503-biopygen43910